MAKTKRPMKNTNPYASRTKEDSEQRFHSEEFSKGYGGIGWPSMEDKYCKKCEYIWQVHKLYAKFERCPKCGE